MVKIVCVNIADCIFSITFGIALTENSKDDTSLYNLFGKGDDHIIKKKIIFNQYGISTSCEYIV